MKKSDIPNLLTIIRGVMTVVLIGLFFTDINNKFYWILGLFLVASLTDLLDGYIARKYHWESKFGVVMDSLLDKGLIIGMMVLLIPYKLVSNWVWILLIAREVIINFVKNSQKKVVVPKMAGKLKMVAEVGLISLGLVRLIGENRYLYWGTNVMAGLSIFLAYYSGYFYVKDIWKK
ncbi:CDP-alcohol phosphatidyltransferase family protein [Candidatus Shapirobacteria bacterium]|nr:CDP-alcohol phosphatidyltransferase family protein [Candidatus Shapirobacteria bacterium]